MTPNAPIVGISCDVTSTKLDVGRGYADAVQRAGGIPVHLAPNIELVSPYLAMCDALVLTGGDDPTMEPFDAPTHPEAKPIHADRQAFELALLDEAWYADCPTLGVCLGMQLMGLHAGAALHQFLPDVLPTAAEHWNRVEHAVHGEFGSGIVHSHHRQALADGGRLDVIMRAHDEVIEGVRAPERQSWVGVQWHPERTATPHLGQHLFDALVIAARSGTPVA
ncbi:MAG: gamma-glutamyl-gamma-aminobutyrate hydrolase family protein [Planctomycetota bacterium]